MQISTALPGNFRGALMRGMRGQCPRCGEGELFRKWLKPQATCPHCTLDLTPQQADDFPAYIAIFITGHLVGPLIIMLALEYALSSWQIAAILVPMATLMMLAMLQPVKGGVIAAQWWHGMHGFVKERVGAPPR